MKKHFCAIFIMLAVTMRVMAGDIWVAPSGSDLADGTREHPLQTLRQALRQAREWRRLGDARVAGGINIILRDGIYELSEPIFVRPEDSGTPDSKTIIRSENAGGAHLSGGVTVDGWRDEDGLMVADAPRVNGRRLMIRQLWADGHKLLRANQFGRGQMERMIDFNLADRTITIPTPKQIRSVADAPQLEMLVHQRWAIAILRVKDMKVNGDQTIVSFHEPESRLEFEHPWPQPVIGGEHGNSSFCLMNAKQFLDEPGEWWQDEESGKVYGLRFEVSGLRFGLTELDANNPNDMKRNLKFQTVSREAKPQTSNLKPQTIIAPRLSRLLLIEGSGSERVHDIVFRDVCFEYAGWIRPSEQGHVTLQGGFPIVDAYKLQTPGFPWSKTLENQAWLERPQAAVDVRWAERVDFEGCRFEHLAATALDYSVGARDITVSENTFRDIGGTAILLGSFAEGGTEVHRPYRTSPDDEEYCERLTITRNHICDATNEDWGCVGIGAGFVRHAQITENEVCHVNYSGICVGWGWSTDACGMCDNHIDRNYVHHFAAQLYDAGGIYTLSNQPGSTIKDNRIDSLIRAPYATNDRGFYIYLDEATDGYTISGNRVPEKKFGDNKPGPKVVWE